MIAVPMHRKLGLTEATHFYDDDGDLLLPDNVGDGVAATIAEQKSSQELRAAAKQQAEQVEPDTLLIDDENTSDDAGSGTEIEDGPLDLTSD